MKTLPRWLFALCTFALVAAGVVHAQTRTTADQGRPGNQGSWPVVISGSAPGTSSIVAGPDGGAVNVQSPCVTVVESVTSVGVAATAVPASAQVARKLVVICNSIENTGTPVLKCRADGTNPVVGNTNPGVSLGRGDCVLYSTNIVVNCIADTASTAASSSECK